MSDQEKSDFVPVPLPFQIPEPPDLSKLPLSVIHSSTVETLISQTEDLSARLKVQIRRNAVLERRALELEDSSKNLEKTLNQIKNENEIILEKESSLTGKIHDLQNQLESSKQETSLLETRYTELHALSQKKEEEAQDIAQEQTKKIQDLERLLPLEQENFKFQDENSFLKKKIEELCSYLQKKEDESKEIKNQLQQKNDYLSQQEKTIATLQQQAEYNRKAVEEKTELENMLILKNREKEHATSQLANDLMTSRQELKSLQLMTKNINQEKIQAEAHLKSCEETINTLSRDNSELEKQIENLQNLWYKLQAEHEREKVKTTALTKLNRELSVELQRTKTSSSEAEDAYLKRYITQGKNIQV